MTMINGGELVARTLAQAGVSDVFGVHGGHLETVYQACVAHGIGITDGRDEAGAGHAAEGYARSRLSLGVALATAGPGVTNVITSIANAYADRTPVLYLTGSVPLGHAETNMVQGGIDNVALARPITKWAHRVTATADIPRLVAHAIRVATSGPAGPVLLDLPVDVSFGQVEDGAIRIPATAAADSAPAPQTAAVTRAIALLAGAERPVIMAGEGTWQSDGGQELRSFAEATGIPVFLHYQCQGLLPASHPLHGGTFFKMAELAESGDRPDVILAVGVRFGVFTLAVSDRIVPADATVIHAEIDPAEIGRMRPADVAMVADSRQVLKALNAHAKEQEWADLGSWQRRIQEAKRARQERLSALLTRSGTPIHPYRVASVVADSVDDDTILVGDGAEAHQWLAEVVRRERAGGYFTHGQLGCLGFGLGFAIGVQVAHRDKRVLLVTGDGAVGFTTAEFDTMARHRLPIVVVVMNNRAWGASRHFQEIFSGPGRYIATELAATRYDTVAAGFGCRGRYVDDPSELGPAILHALAAGEPTCINVAVEFAAMPPDAEVLMSAF
jgi:acetolactate synthase-1/2/3 large subunit